MSSRPPPICWRWRKRPHDKERLDSAFRAFHTLKGGAGIVDFTAMAEAVHAAEDVLSSARSGARAITTVLIGDCLAASIKSFNGSMPWSARAIFPKDAEAEASADRRALRPLGR